jgi:hypothetical protein
MPGGTYSSGEVGGTGVSGGIGAPSAKRASSESLT